jgi:Ca2+-binding EF-hand superfamily protein
MTDEKLSSDQVDELIRDGDKYRTGEVSFDFFARMVAQF